MEIREFKNFMFVFVTLCIFKFLFTHDFSVSNEVKPAKPNKTIIKKIKSVETNICKVVVTMYNAVEGQCDADPYTTASMKVINPKKASEHKWIAMSRNLLKRWKGRFNYGDKVKLVGCGEKEGIYTIVDCMNERYVNRIDILETQGVPLYKYKNVKIIRV
jgi:hypothetical protein